MTEIRTIVEDAYREAAILAEDDELEAAKLVEGLRRLNTLFKSLFGHELGEPLTTLNYGKEGLTNTYAQQEDVSSELSSVYVPSNYRLILNLGAATTLYLNPRPRDGARLGIVDNGGNLSSHNLTINGNGRQIESENSVTLTTDSLTRYWFYRDDIGNWVRVTDLTSDDVSPLPEEFDDLLVTLLAVRINPRHGAQTSEEMIETLKRIRKIFRARYKQEKEEDSELGLYRLPSNRGYWQVGNSLREFNRGK